MSLGSGIHMVGLSGPHWCLLTVSHSPLPSSMKPAPILLAEPDPLLHSQCMFFIMALLSFCLAIYGFTYLSISPHILSPSPNIIGSQRARTGVIYLCNPLVRSPYRVGPSVTPWAVTHSAPLSMGFLGKTMEWVAISFTRGNALGAENSILKVVKMIDICWLAVGQKYFTKDIMKIVVPKSQSWELSVLIV